ncbi:hypothetical protein LEP1GSC018_1345 [Leptospira kirschneri str. 2008720114]|nr:hypothetical protein LEP1GSC018_1345 [Leptospira kirschneri str. 2008720114]
MRKENLGKSGPGFLTLVNKLRAENVIQNIVFSLRERFAKVPFRIGFIELMRD